MSCENGNIYSLACSASEKASGFSSDLDLNSFEEMNERQMIQKRREINNFKGFSNTDSLAMINNTTLFKVNDKIDKLEEQIKSLVVKYKDELKKITKRCQKHKQMIVDELKSQQDKQDKLYEDAIDKHHEEIEKLHSQKVSDEAFQNNEIQSIVLSKEKLLDYVIKENDDLEREICMLKDNLIQELNKVEYNHKTAIEDLINKYEMSLNNMKNEITSTVKKLKESASYFDNVINGNEDGYENEIESNEHTKSKNDAQKAAVNLEDNTNLTKLNHYNKHSEYQNIDNDVKISLDKLKTARDLLTDTKAKISQTFAKKEHCQKMIGLKKIHIEHFQKEKNNMENMIIVLSDKIEELDNETAPLHKRKHELETNVKNAYGELIHELNANKILDLEVESFDNKIRVINETIVNSSGLLSSIHVRMNTINKELDHLTQNVHIGVSEVSKKIDIMVENIKLLIRAKNAKEIDRHPLKFPKPITPPWRTTKDMNDPDLFTEAELCQQVNNLFTQ